VVCTNVDKVFNRSKFLVKSSGETDAGTTGDVHLFLAPSPILHHQSIHRTAHLRALSSFCAILNVAFPVVSGRVSRPIPSFGIMINRSST
jgi:hypothetical protein